MYDGTLWSPHLWANISLRANEIKKGGQGVPAPAH